MESGAVESYEHDSPQREDQGLAESLNGESTCHDFPLRESVVIHEAPQEESSMLKDLCQGESFEIRESTREESAGLNASPQEESSMLKDLCQGGLFGLHGFHGESALPQLPPGESSLLYDSPDTEDKVHRESSKHDGPQGESFGPNDSSHRESSVQLDVLQFDTARRDLPQAQTSGRHDSLHRESCELNDSPHEKLSKLHDSLERESSELSDSLHEELPKLHESPHRESSELNDSPHEELSKLHESLELIDPAQRESTVLCDSSHCKAFEQLDSPDGELSKLHESLERESSELNDSSHGELPILHESLHRKSSELNDSSAQRDPPHHKAFGLLDSPHGELPKRHDSLEGESCGLNDSPAQRESTVCCDSRHHKVFRMPDSPHGEFSIHDSCQGESAALNDSHPKESSGLYDLPEGEPVFIPSEVESLLQATLCSRAAAEEKRPCNLLPHIPLNTSPVGEERRSNILPHAPLNTSPAGEERRSNILPHAPLNTSPAGEERLENLMSLASLIARIVGVERLCNFLAHTPLNANTEERIYSLVPRAPHIIPTARESRGRSGGGERKEVGCQWECPESPEKRGSEQGSEERKGGEERRDEGCQGEGPERRDAAVQVNLLAQTHSDTTQQNAQTLDTPSKTELLPSIPLRPPSRSPPPLQSEASSPEEDSLSGPPPGFIAPLSPGEAEIEVELDPWWNSDPDLLPKSRNRKCFHGNIIISQKRPPKKKMRLISESLSQTEGRCTRRRESHIPSKQETPSGVFACTMCETVFRSRLWLTRHSLLHTKDTKERPYPCDICNKSYNQLPSLLRHRKNSHRIFKSLSQTECRHTRIISHRQRFNHIPSKLETPAGVFACTVCEKVFKYRSWLTRHFLLHTKDTKRRPYPCDICNKSFSHLTSLNTHRRLSHAISKSPSEIEYRCSRGIRHRQRFNHIPSKREIETPAGVFACTVCEKVFKYRSWLTRHFLLHTKDTKRRPYPCDICNKSFSHLTSLNKHRRLSHAISKPLSETEGRSTRTIHHQQRENRNPSKQETETPAAVFACTVCGKVLKSRSLLTTHSLVHKKDTKRNPYPCDICHNSYSHLRSLNRHRSDSHGISEPLSEIEYRGRSLLTIQSLERTKNTTDRPFPCDICHTSFSDQRYLKRHRNLSHAEEGAGPLTDTTSKAKDSVEFAVNVTKAGVNKRSKAGRADTPRSWKCVVCGKGFSQSAALNTHQQLVHTNGSKAWHCHVCGKDFKFRSVLAYHFLRHTGEKPHACQLCGHCFRTKSDLKRHNRTVHGWVKTDSVAKDHIEKAVDATEANVAAEAIVAEGVNTASSASSVLTRTGLRDHLELGKDFFCLECLESFYTAADLQMHMERMHAQERGIEYEGEEERGIEYEGEEERGIEYEGEDERGMEYEGEEERGMDNTVKIDKDTGSCGIKRGGGWPRKDQQGQQDGGRATTIPLEHRRRSFTDTTQTDRQTDHMSMSMSRTAPTDLTASKMDTRAPGMKQTTGRSRKIPESVASYWRLMKKKYIPGKAPTDSPRTPGIPPLASTDPQKDQHAPGGKRKRGRPRKTPLESERLFCASGEYTRHTHTEKKDTERYTQHTHTEKNDTERYTRNTHTEKNDTERYTGISVDRRADIALFILPCSVVLEPLPLHLSDLETYRIGQLD